MRALCIAIVLLFFVGCKPVLKTAYGIKKPKLETTQSVKRYLVKNKVDTTHVYAFKDLNAFAAANAKNLINVPDVIFFNKSGNLVRYKKETEDCNAKVDDFIGELENFSTLDEDPRVTMDELAQMLAGKPINERADVNVFITWTVYAGRLNKTKAFEWIHLIEKAKAKGISANWYLLNCDFQKSWNMPPQVLDKLGIKN